MADTHEKEKGLFRNLLSGNSSKPTLLRGDPHERGVIGSARRARQEEASRHSEAQRSSTLQQVRTRFHDQASSLQSSWGFIVMMMMMLMMLSTKVLFFVQWTGLLSGGPTENSHVPALILRRI